MAKNQLHLDIYIYILNIYIPFWKKNKRIPWDTLKILDNYPTCPKKNGGHVPKKCMEFFSKGKNPETPKPSAELGAPSHWAQLLRSTWVTLPQSEDAVGCCRGGWDPRYRWGSSVVRMGTQIYKPFTKIGHLEVQKRGGIHPYIFPDLPLLGGCAPRYSR